jgi:hypothetical protein
MKPGYSVSATGPEFQTHKTTGSHGYVPTHDEMLASFFIAGPHIRSGADLGQIDMRSIAATLAKAIGVSLSTADLPPLPIFTTSP